MSKGRQKASETENAIPLEPNTRFNHKNRRISMRDLQPVCVTHGSARHSFKELRGVLLDHTKASPPSQVSWIKVADRSSDCPRRCSCLAAELCLPLFGTFSIFFSTSYKSCSLKKTSSQTDMLWASSDSRLLGYPVVHRFLAEGERNPHCSGVCFVPW